MPSIHFLKIVFVLKRKDRLCVCKGMVIDMLNIVQFGAVGDGVAINTKSIQAAVDAANKTGETVQIPGGVFMTGTINLNGVSLYLEPCAVLKGSPNMEDYPVQPYYHNEMGQLTAMIVNLGHDNVTIEGSGTIDLNGTSFFDTTGRAVPESRVPFTEEQVAECTYPQSYRPAQCIFFHNSKNITVRGIKIIDAPRWTFSFNECENVKMLDLTIDTNLNVPNDDGMHFCSCKGVLIANCYISSGDDCIALSSITNWSKPCEDIVISNCVLRSCSKAIVIGYIYSLIKNVTISNCIIKESNRGLCFMCNDESALVENVRISNMIIDTRVRAGNWWGNGEPIFMMAVKHNFGDPEAQNPHTATDCAIRNIHIDGVTCMGENAIGVYGTDDNIREVELRNIDYIRKPSKNLPLKGSSFDFAPGKVNFDIPEDCGVYIGGGADVRMENVNTRQWRIIRE